MEFGAGARSVAVGHGDPAQEMVAPPESTVYRTLVPLTGLFEASFTVQLTVEVPFGKTVPEAGVQVGVLTPEQLSLPEGGL